MKSICDHPKKDDACHARQGTTLVSDLALRRRLAQHVAAEQTNRLAIKDHLWRITAIAQPQIRYKSAGRNREETGMAGFLQIGVLLAMAAVAGVLIMGIVSMARGKDARKQNKLMQLRVVLQGLALLLLFILSLMAVGS